MQYNDEQRALIRRMGVLSAQIDAAVEADRLAHQAMTHQLVDLGTELSGALRRATEIGTLLRQHGDTFREFLDTL